MYMIDHGLKVPVRGPKLHFNGYPHLQSKFLADPWTFSGSLFQYENQTAKPAAALAMYILNQRFKALPKKIQDLPT